MMQHTALRFTTLIALVGLALGSASAQTNLLVNSDLETNAGFSFEDPNCQDFWGGFCGFDGWNTDFADDGVFNFSWDSASPGGLRLANVFPAGEDPSDPVLLGDSSALILGSFDAGTSSVLLQQVAVSPGDQVRVGMFAYSDSTTISNNGFPDTFYGQLTENVLRMRVEFFDLLGLGGFAADTEQIIFDPANQGIDLTTFRNDEFEDKWIEAAITVTVPGGADFVRLAVLADQVNNAGGLAFFDTASIVNLTTGTPAVGDFDFDGELTSDDLRMLTLAVSGDLIPDEDDGDRFDLTGDTLFTQADIDAWQALVGIDGDFNGDGLVDNGDLNLLLGSWGAATVPPTWVNGFTAPVDNGELNALLGNWGAGVVTAIPEPSTFIVTLVAATSLAGVRRAH